MKFTGPIYTIIVFLIGYRYTVLMALIHMGIVVIFEIITLILDRVMWKQAKKHKAQTVFVTNKKDPRLYG